MNNSASGPAERVQHEGNQRLAVLGLDRIEVGEIATSIHVGIIAEDVCLVPTICREKENLRLMPASHSPKCRSVSFSGLKPASKNASAAAKGASRKRDTRCEVQLRKALWRFGIRYRIAPASLPGRPDIVIANHRTAIFCDGDFWHGRNLDERLAKLSKGHNPGYWVQKIQQNVARDRRRDQELESLGWSTIRIWETDILRDPEDIAHSILKYIWGHRGFVWVS